MRCLAIVSFCMGLLFGNCNTYNNCSYYNDYIIAQSIISEASKHNIDPKIVYTIAKIESSFNPLTIAFTSTDTKNEYKFDKSVTKKQPYKKKFLVSIIAEDKQTLKEIVKELVAGGYSVDVGLMQINSQNFHIDDLDEIIEIDKNIQKAISVLDICQKSFGSTKNIIECYNKGFRAKNSNDYFSKFKNSFLKDFGGVI